MEGVNILSQQNIYNTYLPEWCIAAGLILTLISAVLVIVSIVNESWVGFAFAFIGIIAGIVIGSCGGSYNKASINYVEYKVTIDDDVSMNEFYEHYEVLDQEGKIFIVREKK